MKAMSAFTDAVVLVCILFSRSIIVIGSTSTHDSSHETMTTILQQLKIKDNAQMSMLPTAIHHLNRGGLDIMNPCMLPYLRVIIEKVASLINEV